MTSDVARKITSEYIANSENGGYDPERGECDGHDRLTLAGTAMGKAKAATRPGKLTKRQQRLKAAIAALIARDGRSPSYAEIAKRLRVNPSAVFVQVMALETKGHVAVTRGKARSIRILGEG